MESAKKCATMSPIRSIVRVQGTSYRLDGGDHRRCRYGRQRIASWHVIWIASYKTAFVLAQKSREAFAGRDEKRETSSTLARTVTRKVKYADFHQITRRKTCDAPVASQDKLEQIIYVLLGTGVAERSEFSVRFCTSCIRLGVGQNLLLAAAGLVALPPRRRRLAAGAVPK